MIRDHNDSSLYPTATAVPHAPSTLVRPCPHPRANWYTTCPLTPIARLCPHPHAQFGYTPLHITVKNKFEEIGRLLLERGADTEKQSQVSDGENEFRWAIEKQSLVSNEELVSEWVSEWVSESVSERTLY